jgi:hypothetical protein
MLTPTRLLLHPQVKYEHAEPWLNVIDGGKFLIRPPEFFGNSIRSHLVAKQAELAKEIVDFALKACLSYFK